MSGAGKERDYSAEMRLPAGKTCADCRNGKTCDALFGAVRRGFTSCDFWPSRFRDVDGCKNAGALVGAGGECLKCDAEAGEVCKPRPMAPLGKPYEAAGLGGIK